MTNKKTLYLYLLLIPIIDLITSLFARLYPVPISLGVIVKGIFLLITLLYTTFKSTSKYKKLGLVYSSIIFIYIFIYILTKIRYLDFSSFIDEIMYMFKIMYYPLLLPNLLCYFDDKNINKKELIKVLNKSLLIYLILIIIPTVFSLSFNSYDLAEKGIIGWFYSANEVSVIAIILFPLLYINREIKITTFLLTIFSIIVISLIGTKSSMYGLMIITLIILILNIIHKTTKKTMFLSFLIMLSSIFMFYASDKFNLIYYNENVKSVVNKRAEEVKKQQAKDNYQETKLLEEQYKEINKEKKKISKTNHQAKIINKIFDKFLSARDVYFKITYEIYIKHFNIKTLLFGIGFTNNPSIQNFGVEKLIEIDPLDIFFHTGLIALIIVLLPFIYYVCKLIRIKKFNTGIVFNSLMLGLVLAISCIGGHVIMAPAVSLYIVLYFVISFNDLGLINIKKKSIKKNKVTIFALHLNYGGVEKNICNKANILSELYDVEIISLYKLNEKPQFYLNDKVKIKYLTNNIKPNRKKFKEALNSKNILNIIKEGLYAVKVLYLKDVLITKALIECNSEIIISTRIDFSLKLVKNNEYNNIKIAEEHVYHNNNPKYLNKINKILKRIDYLMPSSNYLTKYYKQIFTPYAYKIITNNIPIETDNSISNLNNKNIISVGRLDKVKGFEDLINIFTKINNLDWTLNIVGDGPEFENLDNLIKENKMDNNIKLLGYKTSEELNSLYKESSIYVMTSLEESFGLVLLEAASHGLPIISYSSALGAKEILSGDNGILINDRNEKLMINSLKKLMDNPKLRKEYQDKSINISKNYSYKKVKDENINFFKNIKTNDIYSSLYKGTKKECYSLIEKKLYNKEKEFIITANPETYMLTKTDSIMQQMVYDKENLVVPDGISIVKTANILGYNIKERITGVDLAEELLNIANKNKYSLYLFGSNQNVIDKLEIIIKEKYPNIILLGATNGYIKDKTGVMNYIKIQKPDIVMIALGIPMQEKLIYEHIKDFKKGIFIGVGGSFDVLSGTKKRAPKLFIKLNLEWLYRILCEPKRIIRFINYNIKFLNVIRKEKNTKSVDK